MATISSLSYLISHCTAHPVGRRRSSIHDILPSKATIVLVVVGGRAH